MPGSGPWRPVLKKGMIDPVRNPFRPNFGHATMMLPRLPAWLTTRVMPALLGLFAISRLRRHLRPRFQRRREGPEVDPARSVLRSLFDVHPSAGAAQRRPVGVRTIPIDTIAGTMRHPSQNTADFLPLPALRGANWRARWQRLNLALDRLEILPPIDVVQVGDEYWIEDGHNRVAAALRSGAVEIDADTTQLLLPGIVPSERGWVDPSALVGGEELRQAAAGRHSRTVEQRTAADARSREDLLRTAEDEAGPRP